MQGYLIKRSLGALVIFGYVHDSFYCENALIVKTTMRHKYCFISGQPIN